MSNDDQKRNAKQPAARRVVVWVMAAWRARHDPRRETYLQLANDSTKVVVGHGALASKADIAEFRDMLITSRDRIEKLVNEGKTEQEVLDLKPLADLDTKWAAGNPQLATNHTRNVYNSFKRL